MVIYNPKKYSSRIKFLKIKKMDGFFFKVALSSNASDYQQKLYGTRREAEKTKKSELVTVCVYTHLQLAYTSSVRLPTSSPSRSRV